MYLRTSHTSKGENYALCESYLAARGVWRHRKLVDLGPDPEAWVIYPGGNSFYVREDLEDELRDLEADFTDRELESLFLPFIDPGIRRIVENFTRRDPAGKPWRKYSLEERFRRQKNLHPFDKRRLHYLRCGRVDIGNLEAREWPFLNVLLDKSRDEIECLLGEMERELPPHEVRPYLYTSLRLQDSFRHLAGRNRPETLDPRRVDELFEKTLCFLNRDPLFFRGVPGHEPRRLHPYLVRYLCIYFDNDFDQATGQREYVEDFIRKHRFTQSRTTTVGLSEPEREACRRLGIPPEAFPAMARRDLTSRYRSRAKECHPDLGGENASFVAVKKAYEVLLRRKH